MSCTSPTTTTTASSCKVCTTTTTTTTTSSSSSSSLPRESFACRAGPALISGAAQAVLFNPIDRALYVRVLHRRRHFLDVRNFSRPFQGFANAAVYRTLVGASYMFWQDTFHVYLRTTLPRACRADSSPHVHALLTGLLAGAVSGFSLNVLQAIKFRMWNSDERGVTFVRTAQHMYHEGGVAIFFRGCVTTMLRDSVFGVTYETLRHAALPRNVLAHARHAARRLVWRDKVPSRAHNNNNNDDTDDTDDGGTRKSNNGSHDVDDSKIVSLTSSSSSSRLGAEAFVLNMFAAMLASVLSSPLNYVRSVIYGTPYAAVPLGYVELLRSFAMQCVYIYRHGESYVDRHANTPHAAAPLRSSAAATTTTTTTRGAHCCTRLRGRACCAAQQRQCARERHPREAWRWASSRLNIGWGSLRVGVGMALGQVCFYFVQDLLCTRTSRNSNNVSVGSNNSTRAVSSTTTQATTTAAAAAADGTRAGNSSGDNVTVVLDTVVTHVTTTPSP